MKISLHAKTNLARDVVPDVNLLVVEKHAVDSLDSRLGGLSSLIVDITVTARATLLIGGDFARQNVAESGEGVVKGLQSVQQTWGR